MITIIDMKMGNVASVKKAIDHLGYPSVISDCTEQIKGTDKIVLPGVGSFAEASKRLIESGLKDVIREEVLQNQKPILGICLGMQLLADEGEEGGVSSGLGLIPARVMRLQCPKGFRLPHIGWNNVKNDSSILYKDIPSDSCFYFVHSYHLVPREPVSIGVVDYGVELVASIAKRHVYGTQFHPEKSQQFGLKLLRNFLEEKA